ncbi:histone-lysine N-methyltransferase SETMAR [Trichonephila clavipes]|nr:histone-lysine N-methyltransferase SETMAR [Trichonephila clavipes]
MMEGIFICEVLAKRNEIDPFPKWMVTGDKKWLTHDNIARKRSWLKRGEAAQTVAKPGLTSRKGGEFSLILLRTRDRCVAGSRPCAAEDPPCRGADAREMCQDSKSPR